MKNSLGVRKGAWTAEEDKLLKSCVGNQGEGKWHQVPLKAGLNRCRKSCRLRWLNYLKPNINRGEFKDDEVDLIVKLHKLLGNRWSLIAGRLPGRTANDVKNYWNTHLHKKNSSSSSSLTKQAKGKPAEETIVKTKVIRPLPWTFNRNVLASTPWLFKNPEIASNANHFQAPCNSSFKSATQKEDDEIMRWENLLIDDDTTNFSIIAGCDEGPTNIANLWTQDIEAFAKVGEENFVESDFAFDADFLDIF